jgi:NADH-quinone oxidoreductase subunit H
MASETSARGPRNRTNWSRALAPLAAALALAGLLAAAGAIVMAPPLVGPALVQVTSLSPTDVEPGDRITLTGEGFPAGKEARVRFRGTLHRPGASPVRDVEIAATGVVTSPEAVEVDFREGTQTLFSGAGDRAAHTTFEGEVEVAFAAAAPGAAPVAGVLHDAVLDVRPSVSAADAAREAEGRHVAVFLGLHLAPAARRGIGLMVESVDAGSRADAAGIVAGDVLSTFDGVRASALGDLVPVPGEREATLGVRSAGTTVETPRAVRIDGVGGALPAEFLSAARFVVGAILLLFLFGATPPSFVTAPVQRAAARLRARLDASMGRRPAGGGAASRVVRLVFRDAFPGFTARTASSPLSLGVDAGVAALFAVLPFGQYLIAARLDVGVLFLAATTALTVVAVAGARSGWDALRGAAHVTWQHVPAAVAVASVVLTTGSLRVQEIDRAQGGAPWDWLAFRSPATLVATLLVLACGLIETERAAPAPSAAAALVEDASPRLTPASPWLDAARRAHRFVVAGLATVLFLGGWTLPGLSAAQQDGRLPLEVVGAAWLLAKIVALVLVLAAMRWALPRRRLVESSRSAAVVRLPLAIAALAASVAWAAWTQSAGWRAGQLLVSGTLVGATLLIAVAGVQRLRHGVLAAGGDGHLSPFL